MGGERVLRVLLVEDDPAARRLLRDHLLGSELPVQVEEAEDGEEGLALIAGLEPDLVILDLVMPRVSGLGVLLALQERPPKQRPRILVVSQVSSVALADRVLDLGADFFFQKPVRLGELLTAIQALCPCQEVVPCQPLRRGQADRLLEEMGAPERLQGRRWLAVAAETMAAAGRPILLKEAYYPAVHLSASTYAAVDKNIRDVIRRIHDAGSPAYYAVMGGVPDRCPSNGVFLRCLAHELRRRADSAG